MNPSVYVSIGFLNDFDKTEKALPKSSLHMVDYDLEKKRKSLIRIRDLFLSSNIYTDLKENELEKYYTFKLGRPTNLKELVFHSVLKSGEYVESHRKLFIEKEYEDITGSDISFFLGETKDSCDYQSILKGRVVIGEDLANSLFFLNHSFPPIPTDETLYQIKELRHPCSSLLIIDKYLFDDSKGNPLKIPNLIKLIENILPENLNFKFEIDIITQNKEWQNHSIKSKIQQLTDYFGNKISLHVYAPGKIKEESDRFFITNYAVVVVPHPLDRKTTISSNFFISHEEPRLILDGHKLWKEKVELASKIIINTPSSFGKIKTIWKTDESIHSIFDFQKS